MYNKFIFILTAVSSIHPTVTSSTSTNKEVAHYCFEVPNDVEMVDISPSKIDFYVFNLIVKKTNKIILTVYIGNHPSYPKLPWMVVPVKSSSDSITSIRYHDPKIQGNAEGVLAFNGLTYKKNDFSPWEMIHYYGTELSQQEQKIVAQFISSISITNKHLD